MQIPKFFSLTSILIILLLLVNTTPANAGVFSVTPVRIFMLPKDRAVAITLTNEGDTEIVLQADINAWAQESNGTDQLVLTEDMILSPPIIKLAPRARQVVRLALLKPADASQQLTYRMVMREVPEATAVKDNTMQVPIALALSMPVFITPPAAKHTINCQATRVQTEVQALCENTGTAYAQLRDILIKQQEKTLARFEGGSYILPGARKAISLKTEQALAAGPAQLTVTFDDGKSQLFNVTLP